MREAEVPVEVRLGEDIRLSIYKGPPYVLDAADVTLTRVMEGSGMFPHLVSDSTH